MGLNLKAKQAIVDQVSAIAAQAHSAIAAEYRGLTVEEMSALRVKARASGVCLRVVRNTLARRALQGTDFECMRNDLMGPLVLAFSQEEPGAAARVLGDFAKENDKLNIKLIAFGGKLMPPSDIKVLASMPTHEEALARLMAAMKAPIEKLVRTLAEPHTKLARALAAIRDRQQAA